MRDVHERIHELQLADQFEDTDLIQPLEVRIVKLLRLPDDVGIEEVQQLLKVDECLRVINIDPERSTTSSPDNNKPCKQTGVFHFNGRDVIPPDFKDLNLLESGNGSRAHVGIGPEQFSDDKLPELYPLIARCVQFRIMDNDQALVRRIDPVPSGG